MSLIPKHCFNHHPRSALFSCLLLASPLIANPALAQTVSIQQQAQSYQIPAGSLNRVLSQFAAEAGILLTANAELTDGLKSEGLNGSYSVSNALRQLLDGTGVRFTISGNSVTLLAQAQQAVTTLPPVKIAASHLNATTEGSGSYTTEATAAATGLTLSLRETPQSVTVVTRDRMTDQSLTQMIDVAQQTPGLHVAQGGTIGSDSSPIYSRGFTTNNYMIDGVRLTSSYCCIYQTQDTAIFDRVEVVRGATGLLNGTGRTGASINMVRKQPTKDFQANGRVEAGSWDYYRAEIDVSSPLNASGSVRGRLVVAAQEANSYIDRYEDARKVFYGIVETDIAQATLVRAGASYQEFNFEDVGRSGLPAFFSDGGRTGWRRSDSAAAIWADSTRHSTSAFTQLEHELSKDWQLRAALTHTKYDSDEIIGVANGTPDRETGAGARISSARWEYRPVQDEFDLSLKGRFDALDREHELFAGVSYVQSKQDQDPTYTFWIRQPIPNIYKWDGSFPEAPANPSLGWDTTEEVSSSLYGTLRFNVLDDLSLISGTRITNWQRDQWSHSYASGETTATLRSESGVVTPYAGVVYDISKHWSIYASYTNIFQPQNNKNERGNYLDPVTGNSLEAGLKAAYFNERLNLAAAVYELEEDNRAVAIPDVFAPDGSQAYEALSGTKSRGIELEATGELLPGWQIATGLARNMTTDRDGTRINTAVPQTTVKLFTSYLLPHIGKGLTVGGGLRWQNRTWTEFTWLPGSPVVEQKAYAVVDLQGRYAFTNKLSITLNLFNVFDKEYLNTAAASYYGTPHSFRLAFDMKF